MWLLHEIKAKFYFLAQEITCHFCGTTNDRNVFKRITPLISLTHFRRYGQLLPKCIQFLMDKPQFPNWLIVSYVKSWNHENPRNQVVLFSFRYPHPVIFCPFIPTHVQCFVRLVLESLSNRQERAWKMWPFTIRTAIFRKLLVPKASELPMNFSFILFFLPTTIIL